MKVKIHRINKSNPLPTKANPTDAGYDVYAAEEKAFVRGETRLVPLGIIAQAPEGYHFKLFLRSSMAYKRGFRLANSTGIIDHAYAGPTDQIQALLHLAVLPYQEIKEGERVGQLMLEKNIDIEWDEQIMPDFAGRSRGGFGSTGS